MTVVLGFLTICSGVVLLQLSKSAKDVPDAAVFTGDLDQMHTIAEQEQPETEPKADAIRGTAAIVRRISQARMRMEADEFRRLHEEKLADSMDPINENGGEPEYEWDGLRRRRTMASRARSRSTATSAGVSAPYSPPPHPPLGMSRFPTDAELEEHENDSSTIFSSITGTIRNRNRARTSATMHNFGAADNYPDKPRSSHHPVPLTAISVPEQTHKDDEAGGGRAYYGGPMREQSFLQHQSRSRQSASPQQSLKPPTPPPHGARRQFSFQNVFKRADSAPSEEESVGLVKDGDSDGPSGGTDKETGGPAYL